MNILHALQQINSLVYSLPGEAVCRTCAETLSSFIPKVLIESLNGLDTTMARSGRFCLAVGGEIDQPQATDGTDTIVFKINESGSGLLWSSKPYHLFSALMDILENHAEDDVELWKSARPRRRSFRWHRTTFDQYLNQGGRLIRNFDRELYFRELGRLGFTHVEVNGLAFPMALESGPRGETYPMFYTYCPALDQFVYSDLNKGIYPYYYLSANLSRLKENAQLALKYGLVPGMLCFEPRSVPEQLFERYPMLRGARVDHPFRSFKPRYNLTIAHSQVREHYAEMLQKIMQEVPQLGYLDIWTNDSGAGFEHTQSLYVGRNGGAYLIREWKDDREIARRAGENAIRFLQTLRDAGSAINPAFRVITRLESFYGEHETVWNGLADRIDVETNSLFAKGYQLQYAHPKYPEIQEVSGGSIYQNYVDERELPLCQELAARNALAHFNFSCGSFVIFDPLLGIPYPQLTYRKIHAMHQAGLDYLAHQGGIYPPNLVPFSINHEIMRCYAADPEMELDKTLRSIALKWAGDEDASTLLSAWQDAEEAILAYPLTNGLYTTFGFTWFRLWQRPLVPNLDAISEDERAFYEDYICTTPHNPNNVDLAKDVLFELTTAKRCEADLQRMDQHMWKPMDRAIQRLAERIDTRQREIEAKNVLYDQWIRLRALRCWLRTQYSVNTWVVTVHGYLEAKEVQTKSRYRAQLREMMLHEIENTQELYELWQTAKVDFMAIAKQGETPLIHGRRFGENLLRRMELMRRHLEDEPFIEPNYIEKRAAQMLGHYDLNKVY